MLIKETTLDPTKNERDARRRAAYSVGRDWLPTTLEGCRGGGWQRVQVSLPRVESVSERYLQSEHASRQLSGAYT